MSKYVLQTVSKLKGFNITQTILDVRVHYELSQPENLTTKVEGITKAGLFSFLGGKRLYWL
jgi:hypothetical protein